MKVELTAITPNAELHCELRARDCYDSVSKMKDPTKTTNLVKACTKADHLSINGHASASFRITEVSRELMAQFTRQRTAVFSIRSQRYVKEDNFGYRTPQTIKDDLPSSVAYQKHMDRTQKLYNYLVNERKIPKEDARSVLTNSCHTVINASASFEGWLHFLRRRMDRKAQKEIRDMAFAIYKILNEHAPKVFNKETLLAVRVPDIDEDLL